MSKLSEVLKELLAENNLDYKTFAAEIGVSASRITDYIRNDKLPTVQTLIKIADYFNCSTDYLLGKEYENAHEEFCTPPSFAQRLIFLKENFHLAHKEIYSGKGITKSRYFEWLSGKRQPSIDNVINLAENLHCSIDFILGREN
ncbi:MAG: transcriptional regulator [Clostridia bacterium]|nr:transcriptional regulator [Clostridia bacterium]